ncbi:MAG: Gfo/Idh/MocA family oxidoreductase [Spirochaetales bacterium]|nr:Gfo/Idh/MocA family oxidoreductase [Spirochaetales bacterium]
MIRVGIIGSGFIGGAHAAAYKEIDGVELAAIADVNPEAGEKAASKFGCGFYADAEEMLKNERLDIVDICLPTFMHEKFVLLAASYKKHIVCEKPFALKVEEAESMINAVNKAGVHFMIAQVIRFWPEYVKAKELYSAGEFGDIKLVHASRLAQHPDWTTWHRDVSKSGGGLFDLHIHDVDYMCYLFGEVLQVYALGDKDGNDCWNHVMSSVTFKNGVKAVIEGAFEMTDNYPFTMSMRINGTEATYEYLFKAGFNLEDPESAQRSALLFKKGKDPQSLEIDEFDAYRRELEYFTSCVRDDVEISEARPSDSLYVLKVIEAIKKSLESGKVINI